MYRTFIFQFQMSSRGRYNTGSGGASDKEGNKSQDDELSSPPPKQANLTPDDDTAQWLEKKQSIQQAWAKRNQVVFKVLGKMTVNAHQAALKNVKWEKRFKCKGKNMQVMSMQNTSIKTSSKPH